jgi:hypothetical protein
VDEALAVSMECLTRASRAKAGFLWAGTTVTNHDQNRAPSVRGAGPRVLEFMT